MRPEIGILGDVEGGRTRRAIVRDVAVVRLPSRSGSRTAVAATLECPRRELSPSIEITLPGEAIQHHFIEIRDSQRGHKLVTLIEILSPSNKRPGPNRDAYRAKQREILDSDASLIEIDLLRDGERLLPDLNLSPFLARHPTPVDYLVTVNRAWRRGPGGVGYTLYPCNLREWLPCIPVPLKEGEFEVPLDLQYLVNQAYAKGPYLRGAIDYGRSPAPGLRSEDEAWAGELLRGGGVDVND